MQLPTTKNLVWLSLALTLANLAKFNSFVLYPFLAIMAVLVAVSGTHRARSERFKIYLGGFIGASILSLVWIVLYYIPNTINMPVDVQVRLIQGSLVSGPATFVLPTLVAMAHIPIIRGLAQYILGLVMVFARVTGGNLTYFNGMAANHGFHGYFPELFVFKTQVAFLILGLTTSTVAVVSWLRKRRTSKWQRIVTSFRDHLLEWTLGLFAAGYFIVAVEGNLNLGIRHILPVYLPIFVLVALGSVKIMRRLWRTVWRDLSVAGFTLLLGWYGLSTILTYPSFTSYFNELAGGGANANKYFTDSSLDWGQDLLHLKTYVTDHHIEHFALDYFGGGNPDYTFCARTYDSHHQLITAPSAYDCSHSVMTDWHVQNGPYPGQYIAISESFLESDIYSTPSSGTHNYSYLRMRTPIAKIGDSIYLYKLY